MSRGDTADYEEVQLDGVLAEFREALRSEIKAARAQSASSAIALSDGKRIAQLGSSFQYVFRLDSALNLPDDSPGALVVPHQGSFQVVIVSLQGLAITVSVHEDLGDHVAEASLRSDLTYLMELLIKRIEELSDAPNPAGDRILGLRGVSGEPLFLQSTQPDCNEQQRRAVESALGRDTTFIWGPPGTGKTFAIGALAHALHSRDQSLLLVSHTNVAIDQALRHVAEALAESPEGKEALRSGAVIRLGLPKDPTISAEVLLSTHVDRRSAGLEAQRTRLTEEKESLAPELSRLGRVIEQLDWVERMPHLLASAASDLGALAALEVEVRSVRDRLAELEPQEQRWSEACRAAGEAMKLMRQRDQTLGEIEHQRQRVLRVGAAREQVASKIRDGEASLDESQGRSWLGRKMRGIAAPEVFAERLAELRREDRGLQLEEESHDEDLQRSTGLLQRLTDDLVDFEATYESSPQAVQEEGREFRHDLADARRRLQEAEPSAHRKRRDLRHRLEHEAAAPIAWGLRQEKPAEVEVLMGFLRELDEEVRASLGGTDAEAVRAQMSTLDARAEEIDSEVASIEARLSGIEQEILSQAKLLGTTLTKAYLREEVRQRKFDTVVLDEASMAPIPALWAVAALAERSVVAVGDFLQLPPIVVSEDKVAEKWLGRDVFEAAGCNEPTDFPPHVVMLTRQYRMHPAIASVANTTMYAGRLEDDETETGPKGDERLRRWMSPGWEYEDPILLADTGTLNAWVTSVPRGKGASRLNFMSATVCVDLATMLLSPDRPRLAEGASPRILVVCPYNAHAKLVNAMLKEAGIGNEARAGTAHSFQGTQADVVIMDLVNDEPHWRVGLFIGSLDETNKRLLNVALTRSRRRLIVVGDLDYVQKTGKKAFLGRDLIPLLRERGRVVEAKLLVPNGLAERARCAQGMGSTTGDTVCPPQVVTTQADYYRLLAEDLLDAKRRVVIFSAFITSNRLAQLEPVLRASSC